MASTVVTRSLAIALGLSRYFTGKPCKRGHISERCTGDFGCVDCRQITKSSWNTTNKSRIKHVSAVWYEKNTLSARARYKAWRENNMGTVNARTAKRRALKLQATPTWSNSNLMVVIYKRAKELGLVVDHVIPLQNKVVCGLHVPFNLQLLTRSANATKGNSYEY